MKNAWRLISAILALVCLTTTPLQAQKFQGGLDFMVGVPKGAFKQNLQRNGYGASGHIGFAPEQNPFLVGIEVGYLNYGSESRREPFSTTIPDVTVDVNTTNNFLAMHFTLRIQPNIGNFRPYIDGLIGGNYLFTTTKIENTNNLSQEVASSTNVSDWAFSYGGGGGILIRVYSREEGGKNQEFLLDLGVRYIVGGELQYLKEGSIRRENGRVTYDILQSRTDLMGFLIGVAFRF
jgi:hypothetical protein